MAVAILDEVESAEAKVARNSRASEEAALVAGAKAGQAAAFGELFRRYERRVFRVAHRITRNREDAEDVVQRAFHRAFLYLNSFLAYSTFSTWLTRIAVNEALMTIRRRRHNTVPIGEPTRPDAGVSNEIEDSRPTPEQQYAQWELQCAVRASVFQLRPSLRVVVLLCELRDFSTKETAELLGISVSAVKARLFQARLKLRKLCVESLNRERAQARVRFRSTANKSHNRNGRAIQFEHLCFLGNHRRRHVIRDFQRTRTEPSLFTCEACEPS